MMVYRRGGGQPRSILLFGSGLIGSSIDAALTRRAHWRGSHVAWPWTERLARQAEITRLQGQVTGSSRVDLIWAAGVSGFGSSDAEMDVETGLVEELADLAQSLARTNGRIVIHHFSSMGGLHEGQRGINAHSPVEARRPYGRGKLRQEQLLAQLDSAVTVRVYRPSSVYGPARNGRLGLFSAMISAAVHHRPMDIYGSPHTLRDYVFAPDIGRYISDVVEDMECGSTLELLASGKPTSLGEAIGIVEHIVGRRLYLRYIPVPHNALNMTVESSCLPERLITTPLVTGVGSMFYGLSSSMLLRPARTR